MAIVANDASASPAPSEASSSLLMPIWDYYLPLAELVRKNSNNKGEDVNQQNQYSSQTTSTADSYPSSKDTFSSFNYPTSNTNNSVNSTSTTTEEEHQKKYIKRNRFRTSSPSSHLEGSK